MSGKRKWMRKAAAILCAATMCCGAGFARDFSFSHVCASEPVEPIRIERAQEIAHDVSGVKTLIVELDGECMSDAYVRSGFDGFADYAASYEGRAKRTALQVTQNEFLNELTRQGIEYALEDSYDAAMNGVAIRTDTDNIDEIESMRAVTAVRVANEYAQPSAVADVMSGFDGATGIIDSSELNYKGDGMLIAVIDNGFEITHDAFSTMPTGEDILTIADVSAAGFIANNVYKNAKIPFAYDYAGGDNDVSSSDSHGTHVAGIAAGNNAAAVERDGTLSEFKGVAPNAQIAAMKVFPDGATATADTYIIAALEDCVRLGVDVINLSLGTALGNTTEPDEHAIYARLRALGISVYAAGGNNASSGAEEDLTDANGYLYNYASDPDSGMIDVPASYASVTAVASLNRVGAPYFTASEVSGNIGYTNMKQFGGEEFTADIIRKINALADKRNIVISGDTATLEYVHVPGGGDVREYTSELIAKFDGQNRLALVQRGHVGESGETITFLEKIYYAMQAGALGVIVYNDGRSMGGMDCSSYPDPLIPSCLISLPAGEAMTAQTNGTVTFSADFTEGQNHVSSFSSLGVTPDLHLKPELTAYGGGVYSATVGNNYASMNGTSMATPGVTGVSALVRQRVREDESLPASEVSARVNRLLMSTATLAVDEYGNPFSPRMQGAGVVNAAAALSSACYLTVTDEHGYLSEKPKLELFDDKLKTGVYDLNFTVRNTSGAEVRYSPVVYVMTDGVENERVTQRAHMLTDAEISVEVGGVAADEVIVPANSGVDVSVSVTLTAAQKQYLDQTFENGAYIEGFVRLLGADEETAEIGLPYLAFYGDWTAAPLFDATIYDVAEGIGGADSYRTSIGGSYVRGGSMNGEHTLGYYDYETDEPVDADADKIAISTNGSDGEISAIVGVYGLLRNALSSKVTVVNSANTVIYEKTYDGGYKHYYGESTDVGELDFNITAARLGLVENETYRVRVEATLDVQGEQNNARDGFEFTLTVDGTAPEINSYRAFEEDDKCYVEIQVSDNHYAKAVYAYYVSGGNYHLLTDHPIPVRGERGERTTVKFEVARELYEAYAVSGDLVLGVEDYALNSVMADASEFAPDPPEQPSEPGEPDPPVAPDEYPEIPDPVFPDDEPSDTPVTPDTPSEPDVPDEPNTPDEPSEPDEPDEPNTPDEPSEPDEPNMPDEPSEPDVPDEPNTPDEPSEPDVPDEANIPDEPNTPDEPDGDTLNKPSDKAATGCNGCADADVARAFSLLIVGTGALWLMLKR